jgi:hypothetical protein
MALGLTHALERALLGFRTAPIEGDERRPSHLLANGWRPACGSRGRTGQPGRDRAVIAASIG